MRVTVIATGFEQREGAAAPRAAATPASNAAPSQDVSDIDEIFSIFRR